MIVAKKDELKIKVRVEGRTKVNIEIPEMQDVLFLWESWIKQEEISVEKFLRTSVSTDPYLVLVDYLEANGWEILHKGFSSS